MFIFRPSSSDHCFLAALLLLDTDTLLNQSYCEDTLKITYQGIRDGKKLRNQYLTTLAYLGFPVRSTPPIDNRVLLEQRRRMASSASSSSQGKAKEPLSAKAAALLEAHGHQWYADPVCPRRCSSHQVMVPSCHNIINSVALSLCKAIGAICPVLRDHVSL